MTIDEIVQLHLPRYEELPDLEMYMDQILNLLNRYLSFLNQPQDENVMTKTMVNNYVKQHVLMPPVNKRYTRDHLAHLVVISMLKNVFSITEIGLLLKFQIEAYPLEHSYNYFCEEVERCIISRFTNTPIEHAVAADTDEFEVTLLQTTIQSLVDKLYVQYSMSRVIERLEKGKKV